MRIEGTRAVVTGASRGLGEAIARHLARRGAHPILVARDHDGLRRLHDEIGGTVIAGDLLDEEFRSSLIERAEADGAIDILVNNAAIEHKGPLVDQTAEQIDAVFRLNLTVPTQLCRDALQHMAPRRRGRLVNVSSVAMCTDTPGFATYGASKSGLSALSESLRTELADSSIGVTVVEVGEIDTDMLRDLRSRENTDALFRRFEQLRLQRMLGADEVAQAVCDGIEADKAHVRLPRRSAVGPMLTNTSRSLTRVLLRGVPTD